MVVHRRQTQIRPRLRRPPSWRLPTALVLVLCIITACSVWFWWTGAWITTFKSLLDTPGFYENTCGFRTRDEWHVQCGHLLVHEKPGDARSRKLALKVVRVKQPGPDVQSDPVVFLNGGPGGGNLETNRSAEMAVASFLDTSPWMSGRELILIDPRGAGGSEPDMTCERPPEWNRYQRHIKGFYVRCSIDLQKGDIDLTAYNSHTMVSDLETLRRVLGIRRWNLYGASYGSRVGQLYLQRHPDVVRSVVLEGVVPLATMTFERSPYIRLHEVLGKLEADCQSPSPCDQDALTSFALRDLLIDRLSQTPAELLVSGNEPIRALTGQTTALQRVSDQLLADILFLALYRNDTRDLILKAIKELEDGAVDIGTDTAFEALVYKAVAVARHSDDRSLGAHWSIHCNDYGETDFWSKPSDVHVPKWVERWLEAGKAADPCDYWPRDSANVIGPEPVTENIPVLLLSGDYDPVTPPEWAEMVASHLPNAHWFNFAKTGHYVTENFCAQRVMTQFLDKPEKRPDPVCVSTMTIPTSE